MGTGIVAVVGVHSEASSHRADIQEAQAELRQELAGRNERQRELELLEKGGDPLEFKFVETPPGPWSLLPTDPLAQHIILSGGRSDLDDRRKENSEEFSNLKRARGLIGELCHQDGSATSISVEGTPSDALAATVSSSGGEYGRRDPAKKELDACKSNRVAVKGQYARRNRQRSNRFSNGLTKSQELGKIGMEGGSISSTTATSDAEAQGVTKDTTSPQAVTDEVALQTRDTGSEVGVVGRQGMVPTAVDVPDVATMLQASSMHENTKESSAAETLMVESTKEARAAGGAKGLVQVPLIDSKGGRTSIPSARRDGELDVLLSVSHDAQVTKSTSIESSHDFPPLITKEDKVRVLENNTNIRVTTAQEGDQSKEFLGLKEANIDKDRPVRDNGASPACETTKAFNTGENAAIESGSQGAFLMSGTMEKFLLGKDESLSEIKIDYSLERDINTNESCCELQSQGDIKVKVEDEAHSPSGISPVSKFNSQKSALQSQHLADGSVNAVSAGAVFDDKVSVLSLPKEMRNMDVGVGIEQSCPAAAQDVKKNLAIKDSQGCEVTVAAIVDRFNGKSSQEAPQKCCHWDFVLQEMAWLANDFMQERLWKIAAAAHVARWVAQEKQQLEFQEIEIYNRQRKLARILSKAVTKFWQSAKGRLLKDAPGSNSTLTDEVLKLKGNLDPASSSPHVHPIQSYAARFLVDSIEKQWIPQAEAPLTPDRVSEFGMFDFWEEQFSEESLFYTIPQSAMEVYRQSVVSQSEWEYEQRSQEHEATMAESEPHLADGVGPLVSPLVTGKRSSGYLGGNQTCRGSIQTKRMRTSAVAARHRAAGGTGPLVSIPVSYLARSDISSCETNSQQDEMTGFPEGSSVSGRATDADSNGALARYHLAVDGVDSPLKSKKKKKTRHLVGHTGFVGIERETEQLWQHKYHRQSEQSKKKGDQTSLGLEGLGATMGAYHGATGLNSANKLIKQITNRDRNRKPKVGKASLSQPGVGIPWSSVEDQAIIALVHELGVNWELVSDILSATSQLRGIFRKPKDCKERHRVLTDKGGGDGGDSPEDPSSSSYHSVSYKGSTRYIPQHLEDILKIHFDCILQLHQQLHNRKIQGESHEPKQLVPEHESHAIKAPAMTPLELCELSSASGEMVPHSYPLQSAGMPGMLSAGSAIRPTSAVTALQGVPNLQISPSMSPSAALNSTPSRDSQRMGVKMRPGASEEQRLRYNRMVTGHGLPTPAFSATSGLPLVNLPNTMDGTAPCNLPSGNSAGMLCSLSRGMPVTRTGPMGAPNISIGMNNVPTAGMGLSGAGVVNSGSVSSSVNMMRRSREAISTGHSPSVNANIPNQMVSSPTQNFGVQQQLLQHNALQSQQQSPSSSQQQAFNLMRVAKERQQLQQQQQKRMLQQQQSPMSNPLQPSFPSSQALPAAQQQHVLSPHSHLFSQHQQSSQLMLQHHTLQEQQQHTAPLSTVSQATVSPLVQPSLSANSQSSQQQQSLQAHQSTSIASSPFQSKHQNASVKQQHPHQHQQQQQGKGIKLLGRGDGQAILLPSQVSPQISGQPLCQAQHMSDAEGVVLQHLADGSSQNLSASLLHVSDAVVQQPFSQKSFSQHQQISQQHSGPLSTSSAIQPASPPAGVSLPQQQQSSVPAGPGPSAQQRRAGQQAQAQHRRPQPSQGTLNSGTSFTSQAAKLGLQASSVPSQLPAAGYQLGANVSSPLGMASPSSNVILSSPNNTSAGGFSSAQWKPGQTFTPMAAGLYNLSRSNSGIAAQAPHMAMSVGMHLPLPNGKQPVMSNNLVMQDISRVGSQHVSGHTGTLPQKVPVVNPRSVGVSQHTAASQQRHFAQQQQPSCTPSNTGGQQLRPPSSGTAPAPE